MLTCRAVGDVHRVSTTIAAKPGGIVMNRIFSSCGVPFVTLSLGLVLHSTACSDSGDGSGNQTTGPTTTSGSSGSGGSGTGGSGTTSTGGAGAATTSTGSGGTASG